MSRVRLFDDVRKTAETAGLESVALAVYDYDTALQFSLHGDQWFHAASTMKVAVLFALLQLAARGELRLTDTLHVRNRFRSVAGGAVFKVRSDRDGDSVVHQRIGRTMPIADLAHAMITRSSNLATNVLVDFLGVQRVSDALAEFEVGGIEVLRGVEDEAAFAKGINNRVTADGLVRLFRLFCPDGPLPDEFREKGMAILYEQEFNRMIPAGLPDHARVAHKTGEISSVCHDAGIVTLPGRKPYVLAILSEGGGEIEKRKKAVARVSKLLFEGIGKIEKEGA